MHSEDGFRIVAGFGKSKKQGIATASAGIAVTAGGSVIRIYRVAYSFGSDAIHKICRVTVLILGELECMCFILLSKKQHTEYTP